MTSPSADVASETGHSLEQRAIDAAKQIAVGLMLLTVIWVIASALVPERTLEGAGARSLLTMPYVAAAVAVVAMFLVNAFAFSTSQLMALGSRAPMAGVGTGALWFVLGVLTIDELSLAALLHLFFGGLLVATLVASLGLLAQLVVRKLS